jgi:DHA1 family bicyclomycin/chloramphenicol resistance-like MFS transporter
VSAISELAVAPAFWVVALTNMFNSAVYFTYLGGGSYAGVHLLGLSPATYGSYLMLVVVGYMTGNLFTGRFTVRIGPTRLMVAGCVILVFVVLFMWGAEATGYLSPITLFVPTLFMGFGNGLVTPNCLALAMSVRPRLAGTAVGFASGLQLAFCALAATTVGWWIAVEESAFPLMLQLTTVATLALVGSLIARRVFPGADGRPGPEAEGEKSR